MKKLVMFCLCMMLASAALAQELVTETVNGVTISFPASFTLTSNNDTSLSLTKEDGTSVNFALPEELSDTFGIEAETGAEAFDELVKTLVDFGAETPEGGITELTINSASAPVKKFNLDGQEIYLGVMTMPDGSWALIGFSAVFDTDTALLESIYSSIVINSATADGDLSAITAALRPSEMPPGTFVMFGTASNIVFDLPEGLRPAADDPVFESATFFGDETNSNLTVFTVDTTFMALETFLDSYISTLASSVADAAFNFAESVVVREGEDGITRYSYQASALEGTTLTAAVAVLALTESTGVIVQGVGPASDENIARYVTTISETMRLVERSAAAERPTETPSTLDFSSAQDVTCTSRGFDVVNSSVGEALVRCPLGCSNSNSASIWGTDIYTDDSAICIAAIHAGVLTAEGGVVKVILQDGQSSYTGSERNGVSTSDYGSWGASFSLEKP